MDSAKDKWLEKWLTNIDMMLWRPILCDPPLCRLCELEDGTYNVNDLADMHEVMDAKDEIMRRETKKSG